jgi:hypothetical protein
MTSPVWIPVALICTAKGLPGISASDMAGYFGVSVITRDAVIAMLAGPDFVPSSVEVAVTVSVPDVGTVRGAVYTPAVVIAPYFAVQVTAEL